MNRNEKLEVLTDKTGSLSSKRVWAFRWGNLTIIQIAIFQIYLVANILFANFIPPIIADLTPLIADVLKFTISVTASACLLALGLTVPESFSPLAKVSQSITKKVEEKVDTIEQPKPTECKDEEDNR